MALPQHQPVLRFVVPVTPDSTAGFQEAIAEHGMGSRPRRTTTKRPACATNADRPNLNPVHENLNGVKILRRDGYGYTTNGVCRHGAAFAAPERGCGHSGGRLAGNAGSGWRASGWPATWAAWAARPRAPPQRPSGRSGGQGAGRASWWPSKKMKFPTLTHWTAPVRTKLLCTQITARRVRVPPCP